MRLSLLALLPVALLAGAVHGQESTGGAGGGAGGKYLPPIDSGGSIKPIDPDPPEEEDPAPKKPRAVPSSGSSSARGATANGASSGRGGSARGGAAGSGAGTLDFTVSVESWESWWERNKSGYLGLKSHLAKQSSRTDFAGQLTGRGRQSQEGASRRPTAQAIEAQVLPLLRELVADSEDGDLVAAAIVALSRATREEAAYALLTTATPLLADAELSVQAAAALALGISGSRAAVPTLDALAQDSAEGRELVGGGSVPELVRATATLAQGLVDDPGVVGNLIAVLHGASEAQRELRISAVVALGLTRQDATGKARDGLLRLLDDRKLDAGVRCFVPTALGKLGDAQAVAPLLKVFVSPDTDNLVRQSAAIGLGQLAGLAQHEVISALRQCIAEGADEQTRHFCLISLAQIGSRSAQDGDGEGVLEKQHAELAALLGDEVARPGHADHRSWAALAAAIYARASDEARAVLVPRVTDAWSKEKDPSFKSAFALALGLMHADAMAAPLLADFRDAKDLGLKGRTAVALGFLGSTDAAEALRHESELKTVPPDYRLEIATGLGLLRDAQAVAVFIETLQSAATQGVAAAAATALGLIGDAQALTPLHDLALDTSRQPSVRALACAALGELCEKTDLPWDERIVANDNYLAGMPVTCLAFGTR